MKTTTKILLLWALVFVVSLFYKMPCNAQTLLIKDLVMVEEELLANFSVELIDKDVYHLLLNGEDVNLYLVRDDEDETNENNYVLKYYKVWNDYQLIGYLYETKPNYYLFEHIND